jgi:hypothetical protein
MFRSDGQELIEPAFETIRILGPKQVVKKHTHRVHSKTFRPAELEINPFRIERVSLPHLELIDRACRVVIAADEPRLPGVPVARLLL